MVEHRIPVPKVIGSSPVALNLRFTWFNYAGVCLSTVLPKLILYSTLRGTNTPRRLYLRQFVLGLNWA